jgi:uncharacterized protein
MERQKLEQILRDQRSRFLAGQAEIIRQLDLTAHLKANGIISVITGVRRCGKSTLLRQISSALPPDAQYLYAAFDDPRLTEFKSADFELLHQIWLSGRVDHGGVDQNKPQFILFDEVQLVEGWERWMDFLAKFPLTKVFITGSNATLLSSEIASALTGRHLDIRLTPLSFAEVSQHVFKDQVLQYDVLSDRAKLMACFADYLSYGGFPQVWLDKNKSLLNEYYNDIIERDILRRVRRINPRYLLELGQILASENSSLLNRSKVAGLLGLKDQVTVGKYLRCFLATFAFSEIRAYSPSVRKQLRSLSKLYCVDHAMGCENGYRRPDGGGSSFETAVFNEILHRGQDIFYWKSKQGYEVDFILVDRRKPIAALQAAFTVDNADTAKREIRALRAVRVELGVERLLIVTAGEKKVLPEEKIEIVPFVEFARIG